MHPSSSRRARRALGERTRATRSSRRCGGARRTVRAGAHRRALLRRLEPLKRPVWTRRFRRKRLSTACEGADLRGARPRRGAAFALWAQRESGQRTRTGSALQRLQIIKVWVEGGAARERVYDVAGDASSAAGVDLADLRAARARVYDQLCTVWRDPDFDPRARPLLRARHRESELPLATWACNANVGRLLARTGLSELAICCDRSVPATIRNGRGRRRSGKRPRIASRHPDAIAPRSWNSEF